MNIKLTNRTTRRLANAHIDLREARHYCKGAARRARFTAKRDARRAARRLPLDLD